ncbi:hypothetical protein R1sor_012366 [Riccia sorocarpa]|uniref:Pentatricopeptide repeat-containing protein n=1 Tax=Riccia sorocarpa TaxID=122646 RepID=A0ABD3I768_9MARC
MWTRGRAASSGLVRFRLLLRSSPFGRYLEISESCEGLCHTSFLHRPGNSVKSYNTFRAVGKDYRESYLEQESYPSLTSRFSASHEVSRRVNTFTSDVSSLFRSTLQSSQLGHYCSYELSRSSVLSARYFGSASYSCTENQTPPNETGDSEQVKNSVAGKSSKTWHTKLSAILATGPLAANGEQSAIKTASPARITSTCPEQNLKPGGDHGRNFSPYFVCQRLRTEGDIDSAWRYFLWVGKQEGYKHGEDTYNMMIQRLCSANRFSRVFELLEEIRAQRFSLTPTTCVAILRSLVSDNMYGKSLAFFRDLGLYGGKVNLAVYNSYLYLLLKAGRYDMIEETFLVMVHRNIVPDVQTYNNLLNALRRTDQPEKVLRYFEEMKQKGYEANTVTYNIVLRSLGILGRNDEVVEVFCEMSKKELVPTSFTGKDFASALRTLREMETRGDKIPVSIYNLFAFFLRDAGKVEEVLELFSGMKVRGCEPDTVTYTTAIGAACKARKADEAFSLHKEMVGKGHTVDVGTWTMLMDVASKTGLEMEEKGLRPGVVIYSQILKLLGQAGKVDKAWKLFLRMQSSNMVNEVIYAMMIRSLARGGSFGKATKLLEEMERNGFAPNHFAYTALIENLAGAKRFEEAEKLMKEMSIDDGCLPDTKTYNSLIRGYFRFCNTNEAIDMYNVMKNMGSKPDSDTFEILIRGLEKAGRKDELKEVMEEMRQLGVVPSVERAECVGSSLPLGVERTKQKQRHNVRGSLPLSR